MKISTTWNTRLGGFPLTIPWGEAFVLVLTMAMVSWVGFDNIAPLADLVPFTQKLLIGGGGGVLIALSFLAHEWGHAWMARRQGLGVGEIKVTWWGGGFESPTIFRSSPHFLGISFAGPVAHFLFAGLLWGATLLLEPGTGTTFLKAQVILQLLLGMGNLLPLFPMDGGVIWAGLLSKRFGGLTPALKWSHWSGPVLVLLGGIVWLFSVPSFTVFLEAPPEDMLTNSIFWSWMVIIMSVSGFISYSWLQGRKLWEFHQRIERWNEHRASDMADFDLSTLEAGQSVKTISRNDLPAWVEKNGHRVGLISPYDLPQDGEGTLLEYMWPLHQIRRVESDQPGGEAYIQLLEQAGPGKGPPPGRVVDPRKGIGIFDPAWLLDRKAEIATS